MVKTLFAAGLIALSVSPGYAQRSGITAEVRLNGGPTVTMTSGTYADGWLDSYLSTIGLLSVLQRN